jgi:hypothetical protein
MDKDNAIQWLHRMLPEDAIAGLHFSLPSRFASTIFAEFHRKGAWEG